MDTPGESSTSYWNYDVFLSFRGEDTRKTFTGHLYTRLRQVGINTFIDDEELRKGEVISRVLEKAIEESRVSIVVFSRNYASSSWCLDELVKILECKDKLKQVVLPVFYKVDPSRVRKQTGRFGKALAEHKERFGGERIDKWRAALTEVANLSGLSLQDVDGHESKFIESIIKEVQQEVNQIPLEVASHPVGIDTRIKEIELLLQSRCEDEVRMVGIYGVGGIGKTTLAKAIYNQIFRHFGDSCFLSNVRSEAADAVGLVKLQEKLLHQILKTTDFNVYGVDEGVELIKARLRSKKVLIVLDDVDHERQLEFLSRERSWFGSGSLIIITTRDKHLLCELRANERYEAKLLNKNEAMQLFSCHAFNRLPPPKEYLELAQGVIKYSGGLPLALVTLGSHLRGRSVDEWGDEVKRLRAIPHHDIQKILEISLGGLGFDTRSVFLDIACVFHGFSKEEVTNTLNECGFHSESEIATLVQKNLLQDADNLLVMHDLVRDMGREIVRLESPRDPGNRSRLFIPQEVHEVLLGEKGSEKVEVLMVDPQAFKSMNLSTEAFTKMKNLRVLKIDKIHISGDFELLTKELRWLSWRECPLKCIPSKFPAEKLVVLDMQYSKIQEFGVNLQCCKSLKKLDLSFCKGLRRTPDFNGSRSLETLRLEDCSSLTVIHESIGNLDRLIELDLSGCEKLTELPSSICLLKSLIYLDIGWCTSIQTLPIDIGDMQSLEVLDASGTFVQQLPGSVELLRYLEVLKVGTGELLRRFLKLEGQNLEAKRSSPGGKVHSVRSLSTFLEDLSLTYCGLSDGDIPGNIGSLSSLICLDLSGNPFQCLPFGFSMLQSLKFLVLNDCRNLKTLQSVSNLESLETLSLVNCIKLVEITELENLPSIRQIDMRNCSSLQNPFKEGFFTAPALAFPSRLYDWQVKASLTLFQDISLFLHSNEIPDWCSNQVTAPSICFTMPSHNEYKFLGMILWFVCDFANSFTCDQSPGWLCSIANKEPSYVQWPQRNDIRRTEHGELSFVYYISMLRDPFNGTVKGGEKMEVCEMMKGWKKVEVDNVVKKIGIHLLYSDLQGKVTSLPILVDQMIQKKRIYDSEEEEKKKRRKGSTR